MIDTIVLLIPSSQFKIIKPNNFIPCADLVYKNAINRAVQNLTASERKSGIYKPRLTLSRHSTIDNRTTHKSQTAATIALKIEFSAPKLLLGNNCEEIENKDFETMIAKLHALLFEMGIQIDRANLRQAPIITIHYAKNIVLTDGSTPYHYIQKIKSSYIPTRVDTTQTDYRNAGHSFKLHCNSYEVIFYDKIYDLQQAKQSSKRAIDAHNNFDIKILDGMRSKKKKFEVLRMEVRLNKCSKIKQLFNKIDVKTDLTLRKLFKPAIARKVLLHYIQEIEQKRPRLLEFRATSDEALLCSLRINNPSLTPKQILQFFGFKKILETKTMHEVKRILAAKYERSWDRFMKEIEHINIPSNDKPFEIIKKQIARCNPLKIKRHQ